MMSSEFEMLGLNASRCGTEVNLVGGEVVACSRPRHTEAMIPEASHHGPVRRRRDDGSGSGQRRPRVMKEKNVIGETKGVHSAWWNTPGWGNGLGWWCGLGSRSRATTSDPAERTSLSVVGCWVAHQCHPLLRLQICVRARLGDALLQMVQGSKHGVQ
ncbi:hypothetical protein B0H12DRAFT_1102891 [Mycena haematopus]|nr:hypothetical protein B0H12DRAFT_1102891 [Mycena haematopus]